MAEKIFSVTGDQYRVIDRKMTEIKRQLNQKEGSPLDPTEVSDLLQRIIEPNFMSISDLKIWKTINIGTGLKTSEQFCAIANVGGKITDYAKDIMAKPDFISSISSIPVELDLCVMTTEEIIGKAGTLKEIYAGIKKLGGELVPAEVGPQLRLQYFEQPKGEWLLIAMESIKDSVGDPGVFRVRCGDDLWLDTDCDGPGSVWGSGCRWVFSRPRCK